MQVRHGIPEDELAARRERLLEQVRRDGATGYVLFDDKYIQYFTGFGFLSTERPVVFAQSAGGDMSSSSRVRGRSHACRDGFERSSPIRSIRGSSTRC